MSRSGSAHSSRVGRSPSNSGGVGHRPHRTAELEEVGNIGRPHLSQSGGTRQTGKQRVQKSKSQPVHRKWRSRPPDAHRVAGYVCLFHFRHSGWYNARSGHRWCPKSQPKWYSEIAGRKVRQPSQVDGPFAFPNKVCPHRRHRNPQSALLQARAQPLTLRQPDNPPRCHPSSAPRPASCQRPGTV